MKIAVVTDDGKTISAHFGRAEKYAILTVEDGKIASREMRDKAGHRQFSAEEEGRHHEGHEHHEGHGHGRHAKEKHQRMFANVQDCDVIVARGMGQGAYLGLQQTGLRPILTDIHDIEEAAQAVIDGTIVDHKDRLH